jgi:hypothetical protein
MRILRAPKNGGHGMKTVKLNLGGQTVEAESLGYKPINEPWSSYQLDDGSIIKIKLVISDVFKLPTSDPLGLPQYMIRSSNVMSVEPLESLSKRDVQ